MQGELEHARRRIADAVTTFATHQQAELDPVDGRRFSDEEHAQRLAALRAPVLAAVDAAVRLADQLVADATQRLDALQAADPAERLTPEERARVQARAAVVQADSAYFSLPQWLSRCHAVLAANDRVGAYLWAHYGRQRSAELQRHARHDPVAGRQLQTLRDLLDQLEATLATPAEGQQARAAQAALQAARELKRYAHAQRRHVEERSATKRRPWPRARGA